MISVQHNKIFRCIYDISNFCTIIDNFPGVNVSLEVIIKKKLKAFDEYNLNMILLIVLFLRCRLSINGWLQNFGDLFYKL